MAVAGSGSGQALLELPGGGPGIASAVEFLTQPIEVDMFFPCSLRRGMVAILPRARLVFAGSRCFFPEPASEYGRIADGAGAARRSRHAQRRKPAVHPGKLDGLVVREPVQIFP